MRKPSRKYYEIFKTTPRQPDEIINDYCRRIAKEQGVLMETVRGKYKEYRFHYADPTHSEPSRTVETDIKRYQQARQQNDTNKLYKDALTQIETLQAELQAARMSGDFSKETTIKVETGKRSEAVCFALLSDWHIEETVKKGAVNGLNEYSLDIAADRAKQCFRAIVNLLGREQHDQKIDKLVLCVIGDMISGNIHSELLENCSLRPMEAMVFVEELLNDGINYLLKHTNVDIDVVWRVGNHTRITKKIHISTEAGNSLETSMFYHLRAYYKTNPRLKWYFNEESYLQYTELFDGGYTICFQHGHAVQYGGGVGGLTIPLNKAISQWQKLKRADLYCLGHWHQFFDGGNFIVNGSLIGYNSYAMFIKAGYEPPKQAFFTINKKWMTKTATYPILFK